MSWQWVRTTCSRPLLRETGPRPIFKETKLALGDSSSPDAPFPMWEIHNHHREQARASKRDREKPRERARFPGPSLGQGYGEWWTISMAEWDFHILVWTQGFFPLLTLMDCSHSALHLTEENSLAFAPPAHREVSGKRKRLNVYV